MTRNWKKFTEAWIRKGKYPRSLKTQQYYRWVIEKFIRFCKKPWREISDDDILRYRAWMEAEQYALSTVWRSLYLIYAFFRQAILKGLVNVNPVKVEYIPQFDPYTRCRFLSEEEEQRLLEAIDVDTQWGLRDYALILFMLRSGRRAGEVLKLRWGDFEVQGEEVWYWWGKKWSCEEAKNAKELSRGRKTLLDAEVWLAVMRFLEGSGRLGGILQKHYIFTCLTDLTGSLQNRWGNDWRNYPIHLSNLTENVKRYARWAELPWEEISLKALRYTAAVHKLRQGLSYKEVAEFIGYEKLEYAKGLFKKMEEIDEII